MVSSVPYFASTFQFCVSLLKREVLKFEADQNTFIIDYTNQETVHFKIKLKTYFFWICTASANVLLEAHKLVFSQIDTSFH